MGKFVISTRKNGEFQFNLKATNGQVILSSEGYTTKAACLNGIESVKKNGPVGKLLEEGKAERFLFPHHQSYGDLKRAAAQNQFDCVLPFHNPEKEILFFHSNTL